MIKEYAYFILYGNLYRVIREHYQETLKLMVKEEWEYDAVTCLWKLVDSPQCEQLSEVVDDFDENPLEVAKRVLKEYGL